MARFSSSPRFRCVLVPLLWIATLLLAPAALANEPPMIVAPSAIARDPGQLVLFNVNTSDPDGDRVTLEAADLPSGSRFRLDGNGNGSFSWTPTVADEGFYAILLIATDNGDPVLSTTFEVALTIGDPNLPPVLDPIGDQMATVGSTLVVPLSATDPEGDPLFFSTAPVLDGSLIQQAGAGTAVFEYTPGPAAVGNQVLTFEVSDGAMSDEETIVITVGEANVPPVLQAIGDRQAEVGTLLEIVLMAHDDDGDGLTFVASGMPDDVVLVDRGDGTGMLEGVPVIEGLFEVTVTVFDDGSPSEAAEETFEIDVQPPPEPEPEDPELVIVEAGFHRVWLDVSGEGALPGAAVELRDPATGGSLGAANADADGFFSVRVRPFVPPCSVEAHADGVVSAVVAVAGAPAGCSEGPRTRVAMALWKCRLGLFVAGHHAMPRSTVRAYDADTGELLGVTRASRWGYFGLRGNPETRPDRIQVSVEGDGVEWMLDPTRVYGRTCQRAHHRHHHGKDRDHRHRKGCRH